MYYARRKTCVVCRILVSFQRTTYTDMSIHQHTCADDPAPGEIETWLFDIERIIGEEWVPNRKCQAIDFPSSTRAAALSRCEE